VVLRHAERIVGYRLMVTDEPAAPAAVAVEVALPPQTAPHEPRG
jgi:hypothetical protein